MPAAAMSTIFPQGYFLGRTETRWPAGGFALTRMVPTVPEHGKRPPTAS